MPSEPTPERGSKIAHTTMKVVDSGVQPTIRLMLKESRCLALLLGPAATKFNVSSASTVISSKGVLALLMGVGAGRSQFEKVVILPDVPDTA